MKEISLESQPKVKIEWKPVFAGPDFASFAIEGRDEPIARTLSAKKRLDSQRLDRRYGPKGPSCECRYTWRVLEDGSRHLKNNDIVEILVSPDREPVTIEFQYCEKDSHFEDKEDIMRFLNFHEFFEDKIIADTIAQYANPVISNVVVEFEFKSENRPRHV